MRLGAGQSMRGAPWDGTRRRLQGARGRPAPVWGPSGTSREGPARPEQRRRRGPAGLRAGPRLLLHRLAGQPHGARSPGQARALSRERQAWASATPGPYCRRARVGNVQEPSEPSTAPRTAPRRQPHVSRGPGRSTRSCRRSRASRERASGVHARVAKAAGRPCEAAATRERLGTETAARGEERTGGTRGGGGRLAGAKTVAGAETRKGEK